MLREAHSHKCENGRGGPLAYALHSFSTLKPLNRSVSNADGDGRCTIHFHFQRKITAFPFQVPFLCVCVYVCVCVCVIH